MEHRWACRAIAHGRLQLVSTGSCRRCSSSAQQNLERCVQAARAGRRAGRRMPAAAAAASPSVDEGGAPSPQPPVSFVKHACVTASHPAHIKLRIPLHLPHCRPPGKGTGAIRMQLPYQEAQLSLQQHHLACRCQPVQRLQPQHRQRRQGGSGLQECRGGRQLRRQRRRSRPCEALHDWRMALPFQPDTLAAGLLVPAELRSRQSLAGTAQQSLRSRWALHMEALCVDQC